MKNYKFIMDGLVFNTDISTEFGKGKDELYLASPSLDWKDKILEYKEEFVLNNDNMDGTAGLETSESFESWLLENKKNESINTIREGFVPAAIFLAIRKKDNKIVGMIHVRKELNAYLNNFGGHIGYSVRESERNKGYAKKILSMGLSYCRENDISKILVTCDSNNIFSIKVITANNGIFENSIMNSEGKKINRYWIDL